MFPKHSSDDRVSDFEREALRSSHSTLTEFGAYLRQNKKWWLTPIIMMFLLVGALLVLGGSPIAPLIYTLF